MHERLTDKTLAGFAEELSARKPVPGGGGAAAYVGTLGVALGSMAGSFALGKASLEQFQDDVRADLEAAERVRGSLIELVDGDAAAYLELSQAYKMDRADASRADVIERATKGAAKVPFAMMREICSAIDLIEDLENKVSHMLLSDIGCGAILCRSALEAASLSVFVNTESLGDRGFAQSLEADCADMLDDYVPRAEAITRRVADRIRRH